jgi:hypothetical protein
MKLLDKKKPHIEVVKVEDDTAIGKEVLKQGI